jgi:hypothetical protein
LVNPPSLPNLALSDFFFFFWLKSPLVAAAAIAAGRDNKNA